MGDVKPWQWIVIIAGVLGLGYTAFTVLGSGKVPNPNEVIVADIETGEMFVLDTSGRKIAILPAPNPETGERTLFPVRKNEEGVWAVTPLLAGTLAEYEGQAAALESRDTRVVRVVEGRPKPLN